MALSTQVWQVCLWISEMQRFQNWTGNIPKFKGWGNEAYPFLRPEKENGLDRRGTQNWANSLKKAFFHHHFLKKSTRGYRALWVALPMLLTYTILPAIEWSVICPEWKHTKTFCFVSRFLNFAVKSYVWLMSLFHYCWKGRSSIILIFYEGGKNSPSGSSIKVLTGKHIIVLL